MRTGVRNVVLLTVDALRADHLACHGYHRETSPNIDRLAADGVQFLHAYSQSSHTRESVPALLTGRYPDQAADGKYALAAASVAERLQLAGVETGAFHSNPFLSRAYGFDRGFERFDDDLRLGRHKLLVLAQRLLDKFRNHHYARADRINERSLGWLDSIEGSQFFLWNHYMDVHGPYEPPDAYRSFGARTVSDSEAQRLYKRSIGDPESITDDERRTLVDLYDAEIRYLDEQVGSFLDALRERNLLKETLVVVTADHGDAFGEHGYYEHPRFLHDELLHVPLLVCGPGLPAEACTAPVGGTDVVPTVLSAMGFDHEALPGVPLDCPGGGDGREDRVVFSQARGEGDESHLRRFSGRDGEGACFVTREVGSGDVVSREMIDGDDDLLETVEQFSAERLGTAASGTDVATNDAVEARLEALGYRER